MRRRRWSRGIVGIIAVIALSGCESRSSAPVPSPSPSPPRSTTSSAVTAADVAGLWSAGRSSSRLPVQVELRTDGSVSGSDGCNSFSGRRWSLDDDRVLLSGRQVTSLVGCTSVPGEWLARATSFRLEEGRLVALDRRSEPLGSLSRTSS